MADLLFDLLAVLHQEKKYRMHDIDLTNFSEDEHKSRFRFGRDSIIFLVELLREDFERQTSRNHALSPTVQVLVALRLFASGSFLQVIGNTVGLPKSTVSLDNSRRFCSINPKAERVYPLADYRQ